MSKQCPCCGESALVINQADLMAFCNVCGEMCEWVNGKWRVVLDVD